MKLAIGTVQFGLKYGIANQLGKVDLKMGKSIISLGRSAGINTLDTAVAYGDSEESLGKIGIKDFNVITKVPGFGSNLKNIHEVLRNYVVNSLAKMQQSVLSGLLLHRPDELVLENGSEIWSALRAVQDEGLVRSIGYSIYSPDELDILYDRYQPDIVQAPYNIVDRRLSSTGWLDNLYEDGVKIHTRSTFLQGLLLMDSAERPIKFDEWDYLWSFWDDWLENNSLSRLQGALQFVMSNPKITKVIIGVDSAYQLDEIIKASKTDVMLPFPKKLCSDSLRLINPANWSNL